VGSSRVVPFLCIVAAQVLFWMLTFPANQATANWTTLPADWAALRARWEYSHAMAAGLNLLALLSLLLAAGRMLDRQAAERAR